MKLRLTRREFLARWRVLRGFAPLRDDVDITRSDGLDFDMHLEAEMDAWYRKLLTQGPPDLLYPEQMSGSVDIVRDVDDGCVVVTLPDEVVRVMSVRLSGWSRDAVIVGDPMCGTALRQLHPFTRACSDSPVAINYGDGTLSLYPAGKDDRLVNLRCVMLRDDEFVLDSAALNDICLNNL